MQCFDSICKSSEYQGQVEISDMSPVKIIWQQRLLDQFSYIIASPLRFEDFIVRLRWNFNHVYVNHIISSVR